MNCSQTVIAAVVLMQHVIEINRTSTGEVSLLGFEGKSLQVILQNLGLEYEVVFPREGTWGRTKSKDNWTGIIGMVHRGQADLGFGLLSVTEERTEVVDFSTAYATEIISFVSKKPGSIRSSFAYVYAFGKNVWILHFCVLTIVSMLFYRFQLKRHFSYIDILLRLFSNVLRQPLIAGDGSHVWKCLYSLWWFYALVISYSYSAVLLSYLTAPSHESPIRDFKELSEAIERGSREIYGFEDGRLLTFLHTSDEEHLRYLAKVMDEKKWFLDASVYGTGKHVTDGSVELDDRNVAESFYADRSDVLISEDTMGMTPIAIATNKGFCYKTRLNKIISNFGSSGLRGKYFHEESFKVSRLTSMRSFEPNHGIPLTITDLSGPFILLLSGFGMSLIVWICEIIYAHFQFQKHN